MIKNVDIVCDLSWGDTGKGKVSAYLARTGDYNYVARWAGGNNAGHTVYVNRKKYKTHIIPSGVFYGVKSVIGPGCVINLKSFNEEMRYLEDNGFKTSLVKISPRAHVVTEDHIKIDEEKNGHLGTTKRGIAPCYSDKMARVGVLAEEVFDSKILFDTEKMKGDILCEGAQGFYLDIDWGNYPYVTSSTTLPYGACSLGFSPKKIRNIWGLAKAYDTRAGKDPFFEGMIDHDEKNLNLLQELGEEFGVTTGRKRLVNWLNLDLLLRSAKISGTTHLVINKMDIFKESKKYKLYYNNKLKSFSNIEEYKRFIFDTVFSNGIKNIIFSGNKYRI